jgi:beta-glucanase (GH16 family)
MKFQLIYLLPIFFIFQISCNETEKKYEMVWSDEFDQDQLLLDEKKWFLETNAPNNGRWYNNELQHYTGRSDNAYVSDGTLKIIAKKEKFINSGTELEFTSARLNSKKNFTYGRVDVRAKLPNEKGTWPAIWTLGSSLETVGWPACGEIDIMEQLFENFTMIQCAIHVPSSHGDDTIVKGVEVTDVTSNFHIYSIEWTESKIDFYVDNKKYFSYAPEDKTPENWPFKNDQYIILNVAVGGSLGGEVGEDFDQGIMEVDYVRLYQKK